MLSSASFSMLAQTNPTPWDLKDGNFEFLNMDDPSSIIYPPSMQGWLATHLISPDVIPTNLVISGDAPLCDTSCAASTTLSMANEWDLGISMYANGAGTVGGVNMPVALAVGVSTINCFGVNVNWIGQLTSNNLASVESMQLYYRLGNTGNWKIVPGSNFTDDSQLLFTPKSFVSKLPAEVDNKPEVQLLWYMYSNDNLLSADRIAVEGIVVNPDSIASNTKQKYCFASGLGCDGNNYTEPNLYSDANHITMVKVSGGTTNFSNGSGCASYTDFTNQIIQCEGGTPYELRITSSITYNAGTVGAWIDWNDDGDFDDASENLGVASTDPNLSTTVLVFTPGATGNFGQKRLRIRNTLIADPIACGTQGYGEVEDYTIEVVDPLDLSPGCVTLTAPTDNKTDLCTGSQLFTWNKATGNPDAYVFYLGTDNPPTTIHDSTDVGTDTSFVNTKLLAPNTTYYWRVMAYNVFGESTGCEVFSFTTAANVDPSIDALLLDGLATDTAEACLNADFPILATISGGTGTINFAWTGSDSLLDDNSINNPVFNGTVANDYYHLRLTVTDYNGCTARETATIFVKENPTPGTLTADKSSVCPNEDVTLTLTGYTDNIQDWEQEITGGSYTSIGNINDVHTTAISNDTKFKVLVEKGGCVAESNEVTVTLKTPPNAPSITVSPANIGCVGDVITLTSSELSDNVWSDAAGSTTQFIEVTSNGVYRVTYTDPATGCSAISSPETIVFKPLPTPNISVNGSLCAGESVNLSTQFSGVLWKLADGSSVSQDDIDVTTAGNYEVTYVDPATNCEGSSSVNLLFNNPPADPIVTASGIACEGNQVSLSTQYASVAWRLNNVTTQANSFTVITDADITVVYEDPATLCTSTVLEQILFDAKPTAPVIEQVGRELVTNPLQIVDWLDSDGNVVFTGDKFTPPNTSGQTFTAVLTDGNSCESDESNEIAYDNTVGLTVYHQAAFMVYPNPATSELNVQLASSNAAGMYHIKDMAGRTVIAVELMPGNNTISLAEIQSGIYILQDNIGNSIRIVKQ